MKKQKITFLSIMQQLKQLKKNMYVFCFKDKQPAQGMQARNGNKKVKHIFFNVIK